ncbi:MAG: c-type cytochrome [Moraxella sp.]|nr:c-type cytochrome [Moraxella sp.]
MKYPAKFPLTLGVAMLALTLGACGGDKAEPTPKQSAKTETPAPKTAEAPAPDKAEVVQEPVKETAAEPAKPDTPADNTANAAADTASPVKPLSIAEGKKRYEQTCKVCHDQGLLDAPKLTDKAEWAKRLEKGVDTLHQHSAKGFNKMPAQAVGGVTEAEVYAAVDYMLEQAK